ncbi:hypothetical protein [Burkholderia sp. Se-20378]|uniref:hypothetical protein n=1 Tax=Burkholderia sp. Se-20378 TaxID=2703899 RepID=UPI0019809CCD|nr:hypothetical protein [Burkholderia sp. Se-20378]MBN3769265.1 endonuclease [Burkholderia sp. Se-20378]
MRKVDRSAVAAPAGLKRKDRKRKTELDRARDHVKSTDPKKGTGVFSVYKLPDVKLALEKLFHGKCAYCESAYASTAPVDVEHFRPKGAVAEDEKHPGYWWLASDWENLLPSCIDCNRRRGQRTPSGFSKLLKYDEKSREFNKSKILKTGKADSFPISGTRAQAEQTKFDKESALLLDPCRDNPSDHIAFNVNGVTSIALVYPKGDGNVARTRFHLAKTDEAKDINEHGSDADALSLSERGAISIHVYGLNRLGLVHERTRILRHLNFLRGVVLELLTVADAVDGDDEIPLMKRRTISRRLCDLSDRILGEIKEMAHDSAPYSVMVSEWIAEFRKELE